MCPKIFTTFIINKEISMFINYSSNVVLYNILNDIKNIIIIRIFSVSIFKYFLPFVLIDKISYIMKSLFTSRNGFLPQSYPEIILHDSTTLII